MEHLIRYPNLNINAVALRTGVSTDKLKKAQLQFLRKHLKRDSPLWTTHKYGRS